MTGAFEGAWTGTMMDAEGFQTGADLVLHGDQELSGELGYRIGGHHAVGKEQSGMVRGKAADTAIHLEFRVAGNLVQFTGERVPSRHHAKAAIIGTYHVTGQT